MTWAAVIGSPIEHSLSPVIHRAAWAQLGIDGWEYHRLEQDTDSLPGFIAGLGADCAGLSVTMPCKQAVMPLLDVIDPLASAVGAVNTVVPSSGVLAGFASAVRRACSMAGCSAPSSALVLGARATASSALAALGELGITSSTVAARRFGGPGSVVAAASRLGVTIEQVLWSDAEAVDRAASSADLVISTLPASAADPLAERLRVREGQILLDVVYSPRDTALRRAFENAGGVVAEGTDMLIFQAGAQVQLMTGRSPDTGVMREALEEELEGRSREGTAL